MILLQQMMVLVVGGPDEDEDDEDDEDDKDDKVLMMMMMLASVIKVPLLCDGRKTMRKVTSCKIPVFVFVTSCNMLLMMVKMIVWAKRWTYCENDDDIYFDDKWW